MFKFKKEKKNIVRFFLSISGPRKERYKITRKMREVFSELQGLRKEAGLSFEFTMCGINVELEGDKKIKNTFFITCASGFEDLVESWIDGVVEKEGLEEES